MADKLFKLQPQDGMWPHFFFWFTVKGDVLFGRDKNDLRYPYEETTYGKLHVYLEDLQGAFKLGRESALWNVAKLVSQAFDGTPAEIAASLKAADIDVTIAQVALWRKEAKP